MKARRVFAALLAVSLVLALPATASYACDGSGYNQPNGAGK